MEKQCKKCKCSFPVDKFQKDVSKKDGLRPECKPCTAARRKEMYDIITARRNNLNSKFKGKDAAKFYEESFEKQEGRCAICLVPENGRYNHLSIDHNHTTGKLRGLLCNNCNRALGLFKDNKDILTKAVDYLRKETH